jgi:mannose-1-phosphate guanylyltransferase
MSIDPNHTRAWAVLLAGGDGTRLQSLTLKVTGDSRPKQFCRLFGDKSLLGHTRERLRPLFHEDRTMFVVTKAHEAFYKEDLFDADVPRVVVQPQNRGTGVAIAVALFRVLQHDANAIVAFFPCDHYYADGAAFAATVRSAMVCARERPQSLILLGTEPSYPEVEYGWIEPGPPILNGCQASLLKVTRFWEKPPLSKARELMSLGCLWNTFVTIGHIGAFLELLRSAVPTAVARIAAALTDHDLEGTYRRLETIDCCRDVLSQQPHRLLVLRDAASGWTDLGNPNRVIDTLVQNHIEPAWLSKYQLDPRDSLCQKSLAEHEEGFSVSTLREVVGSPKPFKRGLETVTNPSSATDLISGGTQVPKPAPCGKLRNRILQRVLDRMKAELATNLDLNTLAAESGYSRSHFLRIFRAAMGCSPHQCLTRLRVEQAKTILRESTISLIDTALDCGFSSHAHFSNTFRQIVGVAPSEYRRTHYSVVENAHPFASNSPPRPNSYREISYSRQTFAESS